jgi:hypothetical protein
MILPPLDRTVCQAMVFVVFVPRGALRLPWHAISDIAGADGT